MGFVLRESNDLTLKQHRKILLKTIQLELDDTVLRKGDRAFTLSQVPISRFLERYDQITLLEFGTRDGFAAELGRKEDVPSLIAGFNG